MCARVHKDAATGAPGALLLLQPQRRSRIQQFAKETRSRSEVLFRRPSRGEVLSSAGASDFQALEGSTLVCGKVPSVFSTTAGKRAAAGGRVQGCAGRHKKKKKGR